MTNLRLAILYLLLREGLRLAPLLWHWLRLYLGTTKLGNVCPQFGRSTLLWRQISEVVIPDNRISLKLFLGKLLSRPRGEVRSRIDFGQGAPGFR